MLVIVRKLLGKFLPGNFLTTATVKLKQQKFFQQTLRQYLEN